jgi:hypothetical protein
LFVQTALGTIITDTITETSLIGSGVGSLSIPANFFKVGDSFVAKMCGYLSCANNETIHIRVKSDGITIADTGVFTMKITTNKFFELTLDFTITKIGHKVTPSSWETTVQTAARLSRDAPGFYGSDNKGQM